MSPRTQLEQTLLTLKPILAAKEQHGEYDNEVQILAVSKRQSALTIRDAYKLGLKSFGENYCQEAIEKMAQLQDLAIDWHFIGPIQSSKCKSIAQHFHWVQSVSRIKEAEKLNNHCPQGKQLQVCVQINIDQEAQKSGISPEELEHFCAQLSQLKSLSLRGIMAIPKAKKNHSEQQASFAKLRQLFLSLQKKYPSVDTLSMGMSQDYSLAIHEGSTMIRLGTQLFGGREIKNEDTS